MATRDDTLAARFLVGGTLAAWLAVSLKSIVNNPLGRRQIAASKNLRHLPPAPRPAKSESIAMKDDSITAQPPSPLPSDDPQRTLKLARPETDNNLPHIGLQGDTYTVLVSGQDTEGRYCLIDMLVPPGGGPPPHRHDFEEAFSLRDGEIEFTFRGEKSIVKAGETINIPANAPHSFTNASGQPVRMLCLCTPAGQEEFFALVGVPVATRTTPPPKPDAAALAAAKQKAEELAPKYRTEFIRP